MTEINWPLVDVAGELRRQTDTWGQQNHIDGTGHVQFRHDSMVARTRCERARDEGTMSWRHVLAEEVAEAFAESDVVRLRAELIQVAAVAVNWAEHIDRRLRAAGIDETTRIPTGRPCPECGGQPWVYAPVLLTFFCEALSCGHQSSEVDK